MTTNNDTAEREAIVRWLREKAETMRSRIRAYIETGDLMEATLLDLCVAADAIERGDHLPSPPTQEPWIQEFIDVYIAPKDATHVAEFLQSKCRTTSLAAQDGLDWKEAHENLLAVRQQDIAALQSKIESLEAQLKFKNEAIILTKGCPGKIVVREGFYVLDCYKKKHKPALSAIKGDKS